MRERMGIVFDSPNKLDKKSSHLYHLLYQKDIVRYYPDLLNKVVEKFFKESEEATDYMYNFKGGYFGFCRSDLIKT